MLRRRGWFRVLSLLPVFLLAGLAASSASSASSASPAPPRPVTLQLKWKHQFQFAGYYAAAEKGYYREAGLDVRIVEAQEGRDAVDAVLAGEAEYGVGTSDLLLRRARGQKVVVLGVVFQHSALVLLVRRGPHLGNVHELAGKRVMLQPGEAEVLAYLRREGVFPERLTIVPHSFDVAALIEGKVDALSAYSTDEPFVVRETGMDVLVFTPRAAGIDFYGDNLFTTEAEIEAHPERVRAFRAASLRGWRYAIEHPGEIADLILARFGPRHSREHLLFEAEEMKRLLQPALVEPGYMNPGRWRHMADTYAELGMLPPGISLQGFLYDPDPKVDLKWLYRGLGAALALILAGGLFLLQIVRLNRRLEREVKERRTAEEKFRGLVEQSLAGTYIIQDGLFVYVNSRFAEMFGYQAEEIIGRKGPLDLCSEAAREEVRENLRRRVDGETQAVRYSFTAVRKDGSLVEVDVNGEAVDFEGRPAIVGVALDVTESRRAERQLSHLAFYDPLTDLPNRALFFDRLGQVLTFSQRGGEPFALLLLDLSLIHI